MWTAGRCDGWAVASIIRYSNAVKLLRGSRAHCLLAQRLHAGVGVRLGVCWLTLKKEGVASVERGEIIKVSVQFLCGDVSSVLNKDRGRGAYPFPFCAYDEGSHGSRLRSRARR